MQYNIDFSGIDMLELKRTGITLEEVQSIFLGVTSIVKPFTEFDYIIGFRSKRKFVHIVYKISPNVNFEAEALQIDLPYEEDVKKYWCRDKKIDYFAIVRNTPGHLLPRSESIKDLRRRIEEAKRKGSADSGS